MSDYGDEYIRRSQRVNRVSAGEAVRIANKNSTGRAKIAAILKRLSELRISPEEAISRINNILINQYNQSAEDAAPVANKMVQLEAEWQISIFSKYTNAAINRVPIENAIFAANNKPYQGKTFNEWFRYSGIVKSQKVRQIVDRGFRDGVSIPEITRRVKSEVGSADANLKTLIRSNLLHSSSVGREQMVDANRDLMDGKLWNSTLDHRTTADICGVRDQLEYTNDNQPIGHNLEWGPGPGQIHFNCRSIPIPKIKGVSVFAPRPSIVAGKEYTRGDKTTSRGTVRKPTKANRDNGIFKVQQQKPGTRYEDFLRRQKTDYIADALNSKEAAIAFKNGASLQSVTLGNSPMGSDLLIDQLNQ